MDLNICLIISLLIRKKNAVRKRCSKDGDAGSEEERSDLEYQKEKHRRRVPASCNSVWKWGAGSNNVNECG